MRVTRRQVVRLNKSGVVSLARISHTLGGNETGALPPPLPLFSHAFGFHSQAAEAEGGQLYVRNAGSKK